MELPYRILGFEAPLACFRAHSLPFGVGTRVARNHTLGSVPGRIVSARHMLLFSRDLGARAAAWILVRPTSRPSPA